MKEIFLFALLVFMVKTINAQLITTNPAIPTADKPVTITFDATQGNAGMKGYTGNDVYAYTGVTTNVGKWQFVKETSWLDNPADCKMTRIATDKYQLTISPSIRAFYNVPDSLQIT
ncbi:MAG TPA: Por secretion system protein, partial [Bacteroidales bacterium]